jgi:hypothetical protein
VINAYVEKLQDGRVCHRTVAGLRELFDVTGFENCRGFIEVGNVLLAVMNDRVFSVTEGSGGVYTVTNLGALSGTDRVYLARNNKTPTPDIVAVTGGNAFVLTTGGAPASYPDADVGSPNSVDFQGGYFVFTYGDGTVRSSALNDTAISTLDFANAERRPDALLRGFALGDTFYFCGDDSIECWKVDPNNDVGFPFSYVTTIERGLAGAEAIAGNEASWTNIGIFVGNDNIVYKMAGYQIQPISTPAIQRLIEQYGDASTLKACVYSFSGHPIWELTSDDWTICYDLSTDSWHERKSYGLNNTRARCSVRAFDKWLRGDALTGKVFEVDENYKREAEEPIVSELEGAITASFPNRAVITRCDIDAVMGVGIASGDVPTQTEPQIEISWSLDGGATYSNPVLRGLGAQGKYSNQIRVNRLGMTAYSGFRLKLRWSPAVHVLIFGASIEAESRK